MQTMQAEMGVLREKAEMDRARARDALANAAQVSDENKRLREANPDAVALLESSCDPPPLSGNVSCPENIHVLLSCDLHATSSQ